MHNCTQFREFFLHNVLLLVSAYSGDGWGGSREVEFEVYHINWITKKDQAVCWCTRDRQIFLGKRFKTLLPLAFLSQFASNAIFHPHVEFDENFRNS